MNKAATIATIEKSVRSLDMLMVRIKNSLYNSDPQNLDNILEPYKYFLEFLKKPEYNLREIMGPISYDSIVQYGTDGLNVCTKIYNIFFVESKGLFSTKIKFHEPSPIEMEKAKSYYDDVMVINKKIEDSVSLAMQRIHSLSDNQFF